MKLVIVESPTKAKTISKFLGKDYLIESSFGHVRDLPKSKLGVDVDNNFQPEYTIIPKAKKQIKILKEKMKKSDAVILATDEDREGEAIAYHLAQALDLKNPERIVFHEITKNAIENALKNPRKIDMSLVNAQQARRILDRLVGYKLSPLLWKKIARGLSAGRVQSVAVRLIVERQKEIDEFKPEEYWSIEALLQSRGTTQNKTQNKAENEFIAKLIKKDGKVIPKLGIKTKEEIEKILKDLKGAEYKIVDIQKTEIKKNPLPPFTTSSLQQEANYRLGFSAKQTMFFAQRLYETGLITYHRTDSLNLANDFLQKAQKLIQDKFGKEYGLKIPRVYKTKSKGAQEAHEAIRPTSVEKEPETIKDSLEAKQYKLYNLIWQRAVASQMQPAILDTTKIDIEAKNYIFRSNGHIIKFDGFLKVYPIKTSETILPSLKLNEVLELIKLNSNQHFTKPPAPYTEATLVKTLEEYGIGRPSTYAPTISTIITRNYVEKQRKSLFPTEMGTLVNNLLVKHFPKIVDIKFTAEMENELDKIAQGKKEWIPIIENFYDPFEKNIQEKDKELDKKELTEEKTDKICEKCGKPMIIKLGRYGKFLACSGYPECKNTMPLEKKSEPAGKDCPECGAPMEIKTGRYGKFLGCSNYPKCKHLEKYINGN